jgi:hypothetical protein
MAGGYSDELLLLLLKAGSARERRWRTAESWTCVDLVGRASQSLKQATSANILLAFAKRPMRRASMLNLAKYAAVAALVVGLDVAAAKPASAWGYTWWYNCGDGCGYGYGAFWPPFGFYPYGYDGYRPNYPPYYPHHVYGFYGPRPFYRHR